jgi:hypothetical protein
MNFYINGKSAVFNRGQLGNGMVCSYQQVKNLVYEFQWDIRRLGGLLVPMPSGVE